MYKNRIEKLREQMKDKNLDGALIIGNPNRNYLSGFKNDESFSLITLKEAFFITDSRYTEQAKKEVEDYEIVEYKGKFPDFLADFLKGKSIGSLGFEEDVVTVSLYNELSNKLNIELVPLKGMVENLRIIKDTAEIESIRKAAAIADNAFLHMLKFIKEGMTEREIGLELEYTMKKLGAKDVSFTTIVASGKRSSLPHGAATDKKLEKGDFLTLDFGCIYEDYCSDMTRTVVIGEANEKMTEVYETVLTAQEMALKEIKAGVLARDIDKIARDFIESKGYGKYFGHGLGHGVGREIHEAPRLNPTTSAVLQEGMIVTDEPGIYIEDFGGVRIEDLILVTKDGKEVLSKSPKNLICIN